MTARAVYFALVVPSRGDPVFLWAPEWVDIEENAERFLASGVRRLVVGRTASPLSLLRRYSRELNVDEYTLSLGRRSSGTVFSSFRVDPNCGGSSGRHHSLETMDRDVTVFGG